MTDTEAKTTLWSMFETAVSDVSSFKRRIAELEEDFNADPSPDTAAQIERTKARLEKRVREAAALAIATNRF
jgi:outer membrane murein-binding lipoprotein Lpp